MVSVLTHGVATPLFLSSYSSHY